MTLRMRWRLRDALRLVGVLVLVAASVWLAPAAGRAQEAEDRAGHALFEGGRDAYQDGRFEDALRLFQQAYDLSHRATLLYNIGSAADRAGRPDIALDAFRRYLRADPDVSVRDAVAARVTALERAVPAVAPEPERETTVPLAAVADGPPAASHSITDETWFWVLVAVGGALVIGGAIGIGVAASTPSHQALEPGNVGGVVFALDGP